MEEEKNVVNMAEARKRQQILKRQAKKKKKAQRSHPTSKGTGAKGKIFTVIQFFLFLALMAYMMHLCRLG